MINHSVLTAAAVEQLPHAVTTCSLGRLWACWISPAELCTVVRGIVCCRRMLVSAARRDARSTSVLLTFAATADNGTSCILLQAGLLATLHGGGKGLQQRRSGPMSQPLDNEGPIIYWLVIPWSPLAGLYPSLPSSMPHVKGEGLSLERTWYATMNRIYLKVVLAFMRMHIIHPCYNSQVTQL
jgi:hypothetical protein